MRPSLTKRAMSLITIAVIVYLGYTALFFLMQRRLLFPGAYMRVAADGPIDSVGGFEKLWLPTSGGRVEAWYLPVQSANGTAPHPAVIFTHGNAELIDDWPATMSALSRMGMGVLLMEYPGFGRSEGAPTQASVMEAVVAGYDWLGSRDDIDTARIVAMGRSLGAGPAVALAAERSVRALILQSAFSSVGAIAWGKYRLPPFLVLDPFDNRRGLASFSGPVLIVHGRSDEVIPHRHGVVLSEAAENAELISLDCQHDNCPPSWDDFWVDVGGFLQRAGVLTEPGAEE